jgi:hypothetical protein
MDSPAHRLLGVLWAVRINGILDGEPGSYQPYGQYMTRVIEIGLVKCARYLLCTQ